jgi:hypothetical protein
MAAKDLITLARSKQNIQSITDTSQDALLAALITSVSETIEKYCRRYFVSRAFDELYNGTGDRRLLLRQYPLQSVQSVRYRPVTVLKVINNATAQNQQARVQVTSTGLQCSRVASGTAVTETLLTWASYPTLNQLATAVTALGNGWQGQVVGDSGAGGGSGDYGLWPSADLHVPPSYGDGTTSQGNLTARGQNAELKMHTYELAGYQFDPRGWLLRAIPYTDPELLHPEDLVWPVGIDNFRVQYTAGYTTIPEAVQEACAEWVSELYFLTLRDPSASRVSQQQSASTSYGKFTSAQAERVGAGPSDFVARLLAPYRRHTVTTNQG